MVEFVFFCVWRRSSSAHCCFGKRFIGLTVLLSSEEWGEQLRNISNEVIKKNGNISTWCKGSLGESGGVARGGTRELGSSKFFGCGPGDLVLLLSKSDWLTKSLWTCHVCTHVLVAHDMTDVFIFSSHHLSVTSIRFNTLIITIKAQPGTPSFHLVGGWWSLHLNGKRCGQIYLFAQCRKLSETICGCDKSSSPSSCELLAITAASIYSSDWIRSLVHTRCHVISCQSKGRRFPRIWC